MQYFYIPNTVFFLLISFRQIIFPSSLHLDGANVDTQPRRRNCAVGIFLLAGRRFLHTFAVENIIVKLCNSHRIEDSCVALFRCKPSPKHRPTMLPAISIQAIDDELEKYPPRMAWDYLLELNANPVLGGLDAWRNGFPTPSYTKPSPSPRRWTTPFSNPKVAKAS